MSSSEDDDERHSTHSDGSQANVWSSARGPASSRSSAGHSGPQFSQNIPTLAPANLPSLDAISLKFSQIRDGILSLARSLEVDGDRSISAWPDIVSKFNFLVSQSHILSQTLSNSGTSVEEHVADPRTRKPPLSNLPRLVVHPISTTGEGQTEDFRVASLIRTALIPEMSEQEAKIARAFGAVSANEIDGSNLERLHNLLQAHDGRVSRVFENTVAFREQYDWAARVSVAPPEDAPHSPTINMPAASPGAVAGSSTLIADREEVEENGSDIFDEGGGSEADTAETNTSDEAFLLEAELEDGGDAGGATPSGAPSVTSETSRM